MKLFVQKLFLTFTMLLIIGCPKSRANNVIDSLLAVIENEQDHKVLIENYYKLVKAYKPNDLIKGVEYADKGAELSLLTKDTLNYGVGLFWSGICYTEIGLHKKALDKLSSSLSVFQDIGENHKVIDTWMNIGNVYWFTEDYDMALTIYRDALEISELTKDYMKHGIQMNMAICYSNLNRPDSVSLILDQIKPEMKFWDDENEIILNYLNIGSIYLQQNQLDSALVYLRLSQIGQDVLHEVIRVDLMSSFAQTFVKQGDYQSAQFYLDSCYALASSGQSFYSLKAYYIAKFQMDTSIGNYESAVESHLELTRLRDTINKVDQGRLLSNYKAYYELNLKEQEIDVLQKNNAYINLKSNRNSVLIIALLLVVVLSFLLSLIYMRLNRIKTKSIDELNGLNTKLSNKQKELSNKNETLAAAMSKLKEAQGNLLQSEKLASIGVLAAGVAHEINNPLNYINGGLILMDEVRDEIASYDKISNQFAISHRMMTEGVRKANKVVETLGVYAFEKGSKLEALNLNNAIEQSVDQIQFKLRNDVVIEKYLTDIPFILGDVEKVTTIAVQLLSNAIDAVHDKHFTGDKKIIIKTDVTMIEQNSFATLSISNTGIKIDDANRSKLFDPFFTTKDPDKGYGLGLSIAYNLVRELNGNIIVNHVESGAEFVVLLPIKDK